MRLRMHWLIVGAVCSFGSAAASGGELVATLTLDGLSFISFQDEQVLPIPVGSTIRFRFEEPGSSESVSFTIRPGDVSIAPISLEGGRTLHYTLGGPTSGTVQRAGKDWTLQFDGTVVASLEGRDTRSGSFTYPMSFTTGSVNASDLTRTRSVQVSGMRVADGAWYAQIVGATVNKAEAYPKPGAAVYTVLSGSFDRFPQVE